MPALGSDEVTLAVRVGAGEPSAVEVRVDPSEGGDGVAVGVGVVSDAAPDWGPEPVPVPEPEPDELWGAGAAEEPAGAGAAVVVPVPEPDPEPEPPLPGAEPQPVTGLLPGSAVSFVVSVESMVKNSGPSDGMLHEVLGSLRPPMSPGHLSIPESPALQLSMICCRVAGSHPLMKSACRE